MSVIDVVRRDALTRRETPFGAVGVLHSGDDLDAWWIWKDAEDIDPVLSVADRDDLIYVIHGTLRLELDGRDSVVVESGQLFVIPADTPFRGYRWPRDGGPCQFLAVAPAGTVFTRLN